MPILYLHGVNTRDPKHFDPIKEYLRRIVAESISKDAGTVSISAANWFDLCEPPKWEGISRPESSLLGQGAAIARNELLDAILKKAPSEGGSDSAFTAGQSLKVGQSVRLDGLPTPALADLISIAAGSAGQDPLSRAQIGIAADQVAHDPQVLAGLRAAVSLDSQLEVLTAALQANLARSEGLVGQGVADLFRRVRDRVTESLSRLRSSPAAAVSLVAAEWRPTLNAFVTRFLGDLLFYMTRRGSPDAPGEIPSVLIRELQIAQKNKEARNGEPIVLLTHSMGGQIAYDVLTSFLPTMQSNIKVDYWCATASQVGFFEELNMFLASSPNFSKKTGRRTPFPSKHLGRWWNVWDPNDILSFTTTGIFEDGIDDEKYWSGMSLVAAHGGYLERPSFYREFANKLQQSFRDQ